MQQIERSTNRAWLGDFLRSRRARLSPSDYGFPVMRRRRSLGLRRDEVAQLSGISIAYYTWIEQGRDMNISADVLSAIARALSLTEAERVHLFTLVGLQVAENATGDGCLHPTIANIFNYPSYANCASSSWCALVYDSWFNVLQSTLLATAVFGIEPGGNLESNVLYRLFGDSSQRGVWVDWESEARMAVGMFRHDLARQPTSLEGFRLLDALWKIPEFVRLWESYDVRIRPSPDEFFRPEPWQLVSPELGLVRVHRLAMAIPAAVDRTLLLCSAADAETSCKFRSLRERGKQRVEGDLRPA
jgi:transcriptional regulator with XRE-family HTH domain